MIPAKNRHRRPLGHICLCPSQLETGRGRDTHCREVLGTKVRRLVGSWVYMALSGEVAWKECELDREIACPCFRGMLGAERVQEYKSK